VAQNVSLTIHWEVNRNIYFSFHIFWSINLRMYCHAKKYFQIIGDTFLFIYDPSQCDTCTHRPPSRDVTFFIFPKIQAFSRPVNSSKWEINVHKMAKKMSHETLVVPLRNYHVCFLVALSRTLSPWVWRNIWMAPYCIRENERAVNCPGRWTLLCIQLFQNICFLLGPCVPLESFRHNRLIV